MGGEDLGAIQGYEGEIQAKEQTQINIQVRVTEEGRPGKNSGQ